MCEYETVYLRKFYVVIVSANRMPAGTKYTPQGLFEFELLSLIDVFDIARVKWAVHKLWRIFISYYLKVNHKANYIWVSWVLFHDRENENYLFSCSKFLIHSILKLKYHSAPWLIFPPSFDHCCFDCRELSGSESPDLQKGMEMKFIGIFTALLL